MRVKYEKVPVAMNGARTDFNKNFKWMGSITALVFLVAASGCAKKHGLWSGCKVADDQKGTFMATVNPDDLTQVSIDSAFKQDELSSIYSAIQKWNDHGKSSISRAYFGASVSDVPDSSVPKDRSSCDFDGGSDDSHFSVVRMTSASSWKDLGMSENNPGVTIRCYDGDHLQKQVMVLNPSLVGANQVTSVAVHEFGHALGLDHSCDTGKGSSDFATCTGLKETDGYHQAVMFPTLRISSGGRSTPEVKEDLTANDKDRADCLYKQD